MNRAQLSDLLGIKKKKNKVSFETRLNLISSRAKGRRNALPWSIAAWTALWNSNACCSWFLSLLEYPKPHPMTTGQVVIPKQPHPWTHHQPPRPQDLIYNHLLFSLLSAPRNTTQLSIIIMKKTSNKNQSQFLRDVSHTSSVKRGMLLYTELENFKWLVIMLLLDLTGKAWAECSHWEIQ